eukprot:10368079-Alexandrium_andersonii.AAC.1
MSSCLVLRCAAAPDPVGSRLHRQFRSQCENNGAGCTPSRAAPAAFELSVTAWLGRLGKHLVHRGGGPLLSSLLPTGSLCFGPAVGGGLLTRASPSFASVWLGTPIEGARLVGVPS